MARRRRCSWPSQSVFYFTPWDSAASLCTVILTSRICCLLGGVKKSPFLKRDNWIGLGEWSVLFLVRMVGYSPCILFQFYLKDCCCLVMANHFWILFFSCVFEQGRDAWRCNSMLRVFIKIWAEGVYVQKEAGAVNWLVCGQDIVGDFRISKWSQQHLF